VPPRERVVPSAAVETAPTQRDEHLWIIAERGRMGWQKASRYNRRASEIKHAVQDANGDAHLGSNGHP
jgi:hypothetical protein